SELSPSARLTSEARVIRLASETWVSGQSRSWISGFESARGRFSMSRDRKSNAFGDRWTEEPSRSSSRVSESRTNAPKPTRIVSHQTLRTPSAGSEDWRGRPADLRRAPSEPVAREGGREHGPISPAARRHDPRYDACRADNVGGAPGPHSLDVPGPTERKG